VSETWTEPPPIDTAVVKAALDRMRKDESLEDSPLVQLRAVRGALLVAEHAPGALARDWVLAEFLGKTIRDRLVMARGVGPGWVEPSAPSDIFAALAADFQAGDVDREAWSCLYHRYVIRPPLQVQQIAKHGRLDARQVHRRVNDRGISLLVAALRELEAAASAPHAADPAPDAPSLGGHNLKRLPSAFIGRASLVADVRAALAAAPAVTLLGPGGVGKTRVADEVARGSLGAFRDGVWWVDLAPLADPLVVVPAIIRAMGRPDPARITTAGDLAAALSSKQLLIVLDNCEHLVFACADVAASVLSRCPDVRLVATSRRRLDIEGEQVIDVPAMELPPAGEPQPAAALREFEAIALFEDRARATHSGFRLADHNAAAVAALCRRLDGIPLAIELAAARVRMLSAADIVRQLDHAAHRLAGTRRTGPERHASLEAAFAWSHALLAPAERALFARLAVFRGGWTLEAAERVCADDRLPESEILGLLFRLTDDSLIHVDHDGADARSRILESIRDYAWERLRERREIRALRDRHAAYHLSLAERAEQPLKGGADQAAWLDRLSREHDNLRAALQWLLDADSIADGLRLAGALWRFWYRRGFIAEGRVWLARLLERDVSDVPAAVRAKALGAAGTLATFQGDYAEAEAHAAASLALWRDIGDPAAVANTLNNLGNIAYNQADYGRAQAQYEEALALAQDLGETWTVANVLSNLADVAVSRGDLKTAADHQRHSLALARTLGDESGVAESLYRMGVVASLESDFDTARRYYQDAIQIQRRLGDDRGIAFLEKEIGYLELDLGNFVEALPYFESSLASFRRLGDGWAVGDTLAGLGMAHLELRDWATARQVFDESTAIAEGINHALGRAIALQGVGMLNLRTNDLARAREMLAAALSIAFDVGAWGHCIGWLAGFAELEAVEGRPERALCLVEAHRRLHAVQRTTITPRHAKLLGQISANVQAELDDEARRLSVARGQTMTLEEIVGELTTPNHHSVWPDRPVRSSIAWPKGISRKG